jgi:hypothetical protein
MFTKETLRTVCAVSSVIIQLIILGHLIITPTPPSVGKQLNTTLQDLK